MGWEEEREGEEGREGERRGRKRERERERDSSSGIYFLFIISFIYGFLLFYSCIHMRNYLLKISYPPVYYFNRDSFLKKYHESFDQRVSYSHNMLV